MPKINFKISLTPKQQEAYNLLHDNDTQFLVARWSRQCGKTLFAEIMLIEYLCKYKKFNAYISPSFSQGRKVYKELIDLLGGSGIITKANSSTLTIETKFGSTFQAFSMETPNSIRGYTVSGILVMDEVSFFPDELPDGSEPWSSVIMPITKARKPKVLIISTPKGKRGMFYEMYLRAISNEKGFREITATIYDDKLVTDEEIEDIRRRVSPLGFEEEFMVKFLDSSLTFFKGFEECFNDYEYDDSCEQYIGIDLSANGEDATIVTKINAKNQVKQYKIEGTLDKKYQEIANIINTTRKLQIGYLEINGIGAVMLNQIEKLVSNKSKLKEWTTTNATKETAVSSLAMAIANKEITFNKADNELFSEFGSFIVKYTKTGRMQFQAASGKHDDRIMSLAIALQAKLDSAYKYTKSLIGVVRI